MYSINQSINQSINHLFESGKAHKNRLDRQGSMKE